MVLRINIKKYLFLFLILGVLTTEGNAQQRLQFSQYMYSTSSFNPAYAGSRDVMSFTGLYRTQWVGLEGAPKTATISINTPLSERIGFGASLVNDKIGPSTENNFGIDLSYNIAFGSDYRLFFGIKPSLNLLDVDYNKLDKFDPNDPNFQYNIDRQFAPNIGAGVYLRSEKAYVGLSIPYMLETNHFVQSSSSGVKQKLHTYLMGGYVLDLSYDLKFKPAVLVRMVPGAPLQVDMSANFLYSEKFTLGTSYRWNAAFSTMAGFQVTPAMMVGYSYDTDATKLGNYNSGSHEILLRFDLFKDKLAPLNPRFF